MAKLLLAWRNSLWQFLVPEEPREERWNATSWRACKLSVDLRRRQGDAERRDAILEPAFKNNSVVAVWTLWRESTHTGLVNLFWVSSITREIKLPCQMNESGKSGDLKKLLAHKAGLEPEEQRLFFRGNEKEDGEHLHMEGVKDKSKILLLEDASSKERKLEEIRKHNEMLKASEAVAGVRAEVDKLSERVAALEVAVDGGTKVSEKEFLMSTELLMRQLLKLDDIKAEGDAKLQRKAEVRRVQNFVDTLDSLKARNSNPSSNSGNAVSVTTQWETFDSGMGSLNAPPSSSSSTKATQDWEQFD